jgi:putative DNA primase/helicase
MKKDIKEAIDNAKIYEPKEPDLGVSYRRFSDIEAKPISWLWPYRFARGKVSMVAGDPGLGKSQLTASISAIVTTGGTWPASTDKSGIGNVVILSAEDDAADTIRPRLEAAGADIDKAFILDAVGEGKKRRSFNLADDIQKLEAVLSNIGDVALVVIDPITAYLGGADSHKTADIRALLAPLSDMAARHNVAVICVSHLNKGGSSQALMRVTGSLAFVAAARAAFVVVKDQQNSERRMLLPIKNNIGNDRLGFAFSIQSQILGNGIESSRVEWESHEIDVPADQALADNGEYSSANSAIEEASSFIRELLAEEPVPATEVFDNAKAMGFSKATIRRAATELGIEKHKIGFNKNAKWVWQLPVSKIVKKDEDAHSKI